ncbi:Metal-dependent hydrolases of the beta-lactamase superfamily I [Thermoplasmatales archaeon BRNA1]|nr:Metal-dependent hydrolases of the beta-lactamase superfamily I [Thermoplasmatales archaeon BRNA1]
MFEVHVIASGSDGNCTVIQLDDEAVVIDAGLSYKKLHSLMSVEGVDEGCIKAMLITHEHNDHILGAGAMARKLDIPMYCNLPTFDAFGHGSVSYRQIFTSRPFDLCGMRITPLPTSHDAAEPNAFVFEAEDRNVLLATDTGRLTEPCQAALQRADLAIIESNYDLRMLKEGPYPYPLKQRIASDSGHMCNDATGNWIRTTATARERKIFLAHLSRTNNEPDLARETVSRISGIPRHKIDCLEFQGDTRYLSVSR